MNDESDLLMAADRIGRADLPRAEARQLLAIVSSWPRWRPVVRVEGAVDLPHPGIRSALVRWATLDPMPKLPGLVVEARWDPGPESPQSPSPGRIRVSMGFLGHRAAGAFEPGGRGAPGFDLLDGLHAELVQLARRSAFP